MSNNYDDQTALDINEAAQLIGVTASCLRKWKALGEGPAYFKAGHALRYQRGAILRWIARQTVDPGRDKTS
jgi:hypothetical protein